MEEDIKTLTKYNSNKINIINSTYIRELGDYVLNRSDSIKLLIYYYTITKYSTKTIIPYYYEYYKTSFWL